VRTLRHSHPRTLASSPGLLLAAMACIHPWLEHTMARHMGLELPGLFMIGWFAARCAGDSLIKRTNAWNSQGLAGLLFALSATAFWMLPVALDLAVLKPGIGTAKVVTVVAAGFLVPLSWRPAGPVIQTFFVLNWFWMTLSAGLLYQQSPQQLCSVYLADQQVQAGASIAAWSAAGLALWLWRVGLDALRSDGVRWPAA
jgi:hypothetical protein